MPLQSWLDKMRSKLSRENKTFEKSKLKKQMFFLKKGEEFDSFGPIDNFKTFQIINTSRTLFDLFRKL